MKEVQELYQTVKPLIKTKELYKMKEAARECWACGKPFTKEDKYADNWKVVHYNHITGEFVGITQNECNLAMRLTPRIKIPGIFHNLKGYDARLIWGELGKMSILI